MFERFLGILIIGLVIKFMDDYLDQDLDQLKGHQNLAHFLGRGLLPYTLVLMILALYFNFNETISFFLASYALGMSHDYYEKLPSKLTGWQEGMIIIVICILLTSVKITVIGIILITLLQFFDDLLDYKKDDFLRERNLIYRLGKLNSLLIILILLIVAVRFFPINLILFFLAVSFLYLGLWAFQRKGVNKG